MATAQLGAIVGDIRDLAACRTGNEQSDGALLRAFLANKDEPAFAALTRRHGPMVLRVCLRTLGNAQDAQDALQATFLVLARHASSILKRESLASWLHGVAFRMATHAKRAAARRHKYESQASLAPVQDPALSAAWQEIQILFDKEIERLPETLRSPFVYCCLENKSGAEAAQHFGIAEVTVRKRLSRARKLLQERLTRRGVSLTAVLAAAAVGASAASAGVPRSELASIVKAATQIVAGQALTSSPVSAKVIALVEGANQAMFFTKCKSAMFVLLCLAIVGAVIGLPRPLDADSETKRFVQQTPQMKESKGAADELQTSSDSPAQAEEKDGVTARAELIKPDGKAVIDGIVVDEAGKPVVGATVRTPGWLRPDDTAVTAAGGRFSLKLDAPRASWRALYAATPDGALQGQHRTASLEFGQIVTCRIVLKPAATVRVKVVDGQGAAVPGAVVALDDAAGMLAHSTTDATGTTLMRVPADAKVGVVVGFKGGVGFDYFENYTSSPENPMPVPAAVKLVLDGARTVRIRAVDSADRPLAGIPFHPAYVAKKGKIASIVNTDFLYALADTGALPRSGPDGIAECDWYSLEFKEGIPFVPVTNRFQCPAWPYFNKSTVAFQPARLLRLVKASGRVTSPDGAGAAGILIQAEGRGYTSMYCRTYARTTADGAYSLDLFPDQGYVLAVVDPERAAPNITGVVIREDRPRTDLDFRLAPGTLVEGRVTVGPKGESAAGQTVYLKTLGVPFTEELGKEVKGQRPELIRWAATDSAGRYHLHIGPGEYQIAGPDMTFSDLKVGLEPAIRRDFQLARLPRGPIEVVVRKPDGTPAAGAILLSGAFDDARTDSDGRFRCTRNRKPAMVYAYDPATDSAGVAVVGPDDDSAAVTLRPACSATGRVVGPDGLPRPNCTVSAIIRPAAGGAPEQWARRSAYSGFDGSVTLTGLAEGMKCEIIVCSEARCGLSPVKKFEVNGTNPIDLGDLPLPPDEK